jgi:hypothetical protein
MWKYACGSMSSRYTAQSIFEKALKSVDEYSLNVIPSWEVLLTYRRMHLATVLAVIGA